MRDLGIRAARLAIVLGAALAVAGCGGSEPSTNAADLNSLDANVMIEEPANDASAMESAVNATEPVDTNTGEESNASDDVLGESEGGDTGGNTTGGNVTGM